MLTQLKLQDVALAIITLTICSAFLGVVFFPNVVNAAMQNTVTGLFVGLAAVLPTWITAKRDEQEKANLRAENMTLWRNSNE